MLQSVLSVGQAKLWWFYLQRRGAFLVLNDLQLLGCAIPLSCSYRVNPVMALFKILARRMLCIGLNLDKSILAHHGVGESAACATVFITLSIFLI